MAGPAGPPTTALPNYWLPVQRENESLFSNDRVIKIPAKQNENEGLVTINETTNPKLSQNSQNFVELVQFRIFSKTCPHCTHCRVY